MKDKTFNRLTGFITLGVAVYLCILCIKNGYAVGGTISGIFFGCLLANLYFIEADKIAVLIAKWKGINHE